MDKPKFTIAKKKAPAPSTRRSTNAAKVAHTVLAEVEKGGKVNVSKAMRENGYASATAKNPKKVTKQPAYKDVIDPVVKMMQDARGKYLKELLGSKKKLSKANSMVMSTVIKNLTHDIQLLTGGKTEDVGIAQYQAELEALRQDIMAKRK